MNSLVNLADGRLLSILLILVCHSDCLNRALHLVCTDFVYSALRDAMLLGSRVCRRGGSHSSAEDVASAASLTFTPASSLPSMPM